MSLDYDLRKVDPEIRKSFNLTDREAGLGDNDFSTAWIKAQSVIWATISTTIGEIENEADALEMYLRYKLWSRILGMSEELLVLDDFIAMIGLSTNVFPRKTREEWVASLVEREMKVWTAEVTTKLDRESMGIEL